MPVLRFTTFSDVCGIHPSQRTVLIFSSKCLFNLDGLCSSNAELSIWRGDLLMVCLPLVKHPFSAQACGQVFGSFQEVLFNFYSNRNPHLTLLESISLTLNRDCTFSKDTPWLGKAKTTWQGFVVKLSFDPGYLHVTSLDFWVCLVVRSVIFVRITM